MKGNSWAAAPSDGALSGTEAAENEASAQRNGSLLGLLPRQFRRKPFLKAVVAFPLVRAGKRHEALLRFADQLCAKLGIAEDAENLPTAGWYVSGTDGGGMLDVISLEDEVLVATMRRGLTMVATALTAGRPKEASRSAVSAALDRTELVMRGELLTDNPEKLPALIPSFVFLVTLPIVELDRALDLAGRTSELIDCTLRT